MATRNASSSSNVLLAVILVLTFPIWISIGGALFGVVAGLFGAMIGVVAAVFGVMIGLIALSFKLLFGWGHGDGGLSWNLFPAFHHHGLLLIAIVIIAALIVRGKK